MSSKTAQVASKSIWVIALKDFLDFYVSSGESDELVGRYTVVKLET